MKKTLISILVLASLAALLWAGQFYYKNLRPSSDSTSSPTASSSGPSADNPEPPEDISVNTTGLPLKIADGFSISIFAKNIPGARVMAFDSEGNMWVSQTSQGSVTKLEAENGEVKGQNAVFRNLQKPHGLAFDLENPNILYIAEEHRVSKALLGSEAPLQKIIDLPAGGGHFTRTLRFGPDGRLYVSIGSSCNVCVEKDERRAKIFSMNKDGSDFKEYVQGLRNTVFFTWSYIDGKMWGTDMGRDLLGDNLPPDEINVVSEGKNYGWPYCYGKRIRDQNFMENRNFDCAQTQSSHIDLQAHSAPLGLAFVPEEGWPEDYWYNLLVSFHGSWNRSEPTGYKVVRGKLDDKGNYLGLEDFITGWLTGGGVLGRPVDILVFPGGNAYISDDKAGVIYKISPL